MFHPVRILDSQGNTKKTVSSKKLSKDYWKTFERMGIGPNSGEKTASRKEKISGTAR